MSGADESRGQQPDLVAEARFWREWNTTVYKKAHSREEAEAIAARVSPDPERVAAILARAEAGVALTRPPHAGDSELVRIHADAGRFYQSSLPGSWVPGYLAERRLDAVLLPTSPWKIGYAPRSWTALTDHLRSLGYSHDAMLRSGLAREGNNGLRDMFRDRLMIPVRRPGDRAVIAFVGRRQPDAGDEHGPKYLNSPNTDVYIKGHVLAGLAEGQRFLNAGAQPVIVEGYTDAFAVSIAAPGRYVGLPLCGTALSGQQIAALARAVDLPERGVRIALDPDGAGRKAVVRAYASLSVAADELTAVILPDGRDPAERLQHDGPVALRDTLTSSTCPLAEFVVDAHMSHWACDGELIRVEQQHGALRAVGQAIALMPPHDAGTQASRVTSLFMTKYGWTAEQVTRELVAAVERRYEGTPQSPGDRASFLSVVTMGVVARAVAPYPGTTLRPRPAIQPSPGIQPGVVLRQQRGTTEPDSGR